MSEPIKIVLIDDHALCRRGLSELLEAREGIKVLGTTGDADEAVRLLRDERPDLAIMDLRMVPVDGHHLLTRVRAEGLDTPVVILTMSDSQPGTTRADYMKSLTEREREILQHLAHGKSNKAIAHALGISHDTVKLHVRHILSKLGMRSRVEAAVFAVEHRAATSSA